MALACLLLPCVSSASTRNVNMQVAENSLRDFGYYYAMETPSFDTATEGTTGQVQQMVGGKEDANLAPSGLTMVRLSLSAPPSSTMRGGVGKLSTVCSAHGNSNSSITISYTVPDSMPNDYIGLWCPSSSNATYVSRSGLECEGGGACKPNGVVSFSPAMLAVAGRMQHSIGACEFRYCRDNDTLCGPAKPANFAAVSRPVAVGSCCPPPPAVASLPPIVLAHSTTTFVDTSSFPGPGPFPGQPKPATVLEAANISVVVSGLGGLFLDPNNSTLLRKDWQQQWGRYWDSASPYASSILAFYPIDEPPPTLIASGAYGTLVKAIKTSAPQIPIAAVITPSAVRGIEFGAYSLPPEVDWIGGDQYGCWAEEECDTLGDCCWMNRTIPHNLGVLRDYAKRRGGKVVVVPDGVAAATSEERKHGEKAMPTAAQQAVRAARDRKYYQWCAAEELCVAMWVFLWRSVHTASGWLTGVEDQREVLLPALVEMGTAIKNRSVEMQ